jgi:hypothetical protein
VNIVERARGFVQALWNLASRTAWDWRKCPHCGGTETHRHGSYMRYPWTLDGRQAVRVQRHRCLCCRKSYSETTPLLVRGGWYAREIRRLCVDNWLHGRGSLRRGAELARSFLGKQERWLIWRLFSEDPPESHRCHLGASTIHRWLDGAGREARRTVPGQLEGIEFSGQVGVDGLWARLRGKTKKVVLILVDSVTGIRFPPVVVDGEDEASSWGRMFRRAAASGLELDQLRGVASDGAKGLASYLGKALEWVNHQRCVFHIWRNLGGEFARSVAEAGAELVGEVARKARRQARRELVSLVHAIVDAQSQIAAEAALVRLEEHRLGKSLAASISPHLDALFVYLKEYNRGLMRVAPEFVWRDFRLRLSRGKNHCSTQRLERAGLVFAIYSNFTPAQRRSERKRKYRYPGLSPLAVAGVPPDGISYLDALSV